MTLGAIQQDSFDRAQQIIEARERPLTDKRRKVLAVLLDEGKPLSAYELTDKYNRVYDEHIIAPSVYRILDWLVCANIVHRLNALNKFVACQQEACAQHAPISFLVICKHCEKISEEPVSDKLFSAIDEHISSAKFSIASPHIEMTGECEICQNKTQRKS